MTNSNSSDATCSYPSREAVGVFANPDALEAAVGELEVSGFPRAAISVLASDEKVRERVGRLYRTVGEIEDDRHAPQTGFVSKDSLEGGEAAAVGIPCYLGAVAAVAFIASGGALAVTIAAAVAGGVGGAGLGALLARAISHHHRDHILAQLAQGGMVLWVNVGDAAAERRALQILTKAGGDDVHVHDIQREWTLKDQPLSDVQPDPFLLGEH